MKKSETSFGLKTFRRMSPHVLVVLVFIVALLGAWLGVDFGQHWDEPVVLNQVYHAFDTGLLLSRYYIYPSLAFYLGLAAVTPELTQYLISRPRAPDQRMAYLVRFKFAMLNYLKSDGFKFRVRKIFIVVSLLAIFWIYLLVWVWRKNAWEAFLAAALLGWSWEFSYHARWVVPDAPMLMFTVLTYLFLTLAWTRPDWTRWLKAAAITAALTCGCKYQGGSLMLPVVLSAGWLMHQEKSQTWKRKLVFFLASLFFLFGVVYVFTTPGTLLEPAKFLQNLGEQFGRYRTGHYGYTVHPGAEHYGLMTIYFATAALSSCPWTAAVLFGLAGLGVYDLCRREPRWVAVSFLSFPVFYFFYMGAFSVMIVRNVLLLIPFLAILTARGITWLWHKGGHYAVAKAVLLSVVLIALIWNAYWVLAAGRSIPQTTKAATTKALAAYLEEHPDQVFWLSEAVIGDVAQTVQTPPRNVTRQPAETQYAVFYTSDVTDHGVWPANHRDYFRHWFGPFEVNLNYYPTWMEPHLVILSLEKARKVLPALTPENAN